MPFAFDSPFDSPEHELAWAAGLFEGEGTICAVKAKVVTGTKFYPRAQLGMTDLDVITRFVDIIGIGKVRGPYEKNGSAGIRPKPIYFWAVAKKDEFEEAINMLWPFLGERRREQVHDVFKKINMEVEPVRA